jgi:hypothetical protein
VIALVNDPVPLPSEVALSAVVGLAAALQHTPRAVTGSPPSEVTLPPPVAVAPVILEIAVVVTAGVVSVLKLTSLP